MAKRSFLTNITPLPSSISRETAIAQLHAHPAMIELNPLVLRYELTEPPPNASRDEAESAVWYEITDRINYLPGGAIKGEVAYKACFYNLPNGLQTHVFAPAGVDIRSKWSVRGNMPGEPREPQELGVKAPTEGLYMMEEVDLRCNVFMSNFVRRNLKKSHLVVADKIVQRANAHGMDVPKSIGSPAAASDRSVSRWLEESRQQSNCSQTLRLAQSQQSTNQPSEIQHTQPLHCACVGATHDSGCRFFHPDDLDRYDPAPAAPRNRQSRPYYAISIPSVSSYSQPSSAADSAGQRTYPELEGSPGANSCLCTGAIHEKECRLYPGLRLPNFSSLSIAESQTDSLQHSPAVAYGITGVAPGELMRVATSDANNGDYRPQRPGQQAELSALRSPTGDEQQNIAPEPLSSRASDGPNPGTAYRAANQT